MKRLLLTIVALVFWGMGLASAQTLKPLPAGKYLTSETEKQYIQGVPVPKKIECEVGESSDDFVQIFFRVPNSSSRKSASFSRVKGNTFARKGSDGMIATPVENYLVVREGGVMEVYGMKGNSVEDVLVIADENAKFKTLKKNAKSNKAAFDGASMAASVAAANERLKKEKADAKAKRLAELKAKEEAKVKARNEADLCTPLKNYFELAGANFKSLEGKLDQEETELEEENVYFTNEVLPLFRFGRVVPTWQEGLKQLRFYTKWFYSKAEADAELAFIQSRLDPCFKNKAGFSYSLDSDIHFYQSDDIQMSLMRKTDFNDDLKTVYVVLIQLRRR